MSTLIPGWGQFYSDRSLSGWSFLGGELALLGLGYMSYSSYQTAYDDVNSFYADYQAASDPAQIRLLKEKSMAAEDQMNASNDQLTVMFQAAAKRSWSFGNEHCGHLIGKFPHERIQGEKTLNYIHPQNHTPMNEPDKNGNPREWILEIHFIDESLQIGGFFEQLLTA